MKSQRDSSPSSLKSSLWAAHFAVQNPRICLFLLSLTLTLLPQTLHAQTANEMKNAGPESRPGESDEQHGKRLLDEMLKALGGDAWLNKQTMYLEGQTAPFFRNQPSGGVSRFVEFKRFETANSPEMTRIEFVSYRGMIEPGTVRQVAHLWTADHGYEYTFRGRTELPEKQVVDYFRRRDHSLETLMRDWLKRPGVVIVFEGIGTRDRRPIDKVSILSPDNDTITLEIEQDTHLPLQRAFQWRNEQFKDYDLDEEVYGDWRAYNGIMTPMNVTRYRNGDMTEQTFYKKVQFNVPLADSLFDKDKLLKK